METVATTDPEVPFNLEVHFDHNNYAKVDTTTVRQEDVTNATVSDISRETVQTAKTTAKVTVLRTCRFVTTYG